ncbi:MAG: transcription elongation factor GreA [Patescibacteria group bacterium]
MEYLTKEKYDEFVHELDFLKKVRRKEVAESLEYAKSLGDLSENAEYHEARDIQATIEDRIAHLESILKTAKIVSSHNTDAVTVGSVVTVVKEGASEEKTYTLVGAEESNITSGKISVSSPFGQAILGAKKGDSFTFSAPSGPITYKVVLIK